ncbi:MAG TPA: rhodanese-like domain-containing protein [Bacteroidales bacterium]|nr:rhodanese-like domain-containing protein [Bacteroidales bacterium]
MKNLILIIIFLLSSFLLSAQNTDSVKVVLLKPAEFREEMKIVSNPKLIDVREFFEYKKSRIKGALNIPASGNLEFAADTIEKTSHLFLYCTSGFRSKRVGQRFADRGFVHVYSLDGGITAWKKEGLSIEKKKIRKK